MYIFYIPKLDISNLLFSAKYFIDSLSAIPFLLKESININSGGINTTHGTKIVYSQILIPLDLHFEVDHHHQMFGVLSKIHSLVIY